MKKYYCAKIDATIFNYQSTNKAFFLDYNVNGLVSVGIFGYQKVYASLALNQTKIII